MEWPSTSRRIYRTDFFFIKLRLYFERESDRKLLYIFDLWCASSSVKDRRNGDRIGRKKLFLCFLEGVI
jgi:hypothetical protein